MDVDSKPTQSVATNSTAAVRMSQKLDNRDLTKTSFWISQIFMIIATVIGVFLAAQEGLSQAILFDKLKNKEDNYYLRLSLDKEITTNIKSLKDYAILVDKNKTYDLKAHRPILLNFVWENMKYSRATLQTPSNILSKASQFYSQSNVIISRIENRKIAAKFGANQLNELIADMEKTGLETLRKNHQLLAQELKDADYPVNE